MQVYSHSAVVLAATAVAFAGACSPAGLSLLSTHGLLPRSSLMQFHTHSAVTLAATAMLVAGSSSPAGVPQLHRHGLLPETEALPPHHAAPHERPLQGL